LLSLLVGAFAEKTKPGKAIEALLVAIVLASMVSVGMQLYQWLSLSGAESWILPLAETRPFANLAQPNQLATFLLWGLTAVAWAALHNKLGPAVALFVALFLLFGVALTQSRTAILTIFLLLGMTCYWRKLWPASNEVVKVAAALAAYFGACLLLIEPISTALLLEKPFNAVTRIAGPDIRWDVLKLFIDAALQKPWLGYGWTTLAPAQLAVAENHPSLGGIFQQSHNLFLDLILWLGIPMGGAVSVGLTAWFIGHLRRVACAKDALLVMFLLVVAVHAMLELPLHYAYMLLPAGLVAGTLDARLSAPVLLHTGRRVMVAIWLMAAVLLAAITRDYLLIEADFQALRFERAYNMAPPKNPPRILVLSQLAEFIRFGRSAANAGMSQAQLNEMRDASEVFPSPSNLYLYTAALAMNGRADEARLRMRKMAGIMPSASYLQMGRVWAEQSKMNKDLANVAWLGLNDGSVRGGTTEGK
jgi:hypothetical protein